MSAMRPLRQVVFLVGFLRAAESFERLEIPALRFTHKEIAERLHARNRLQLFRINEIGFEQRRIFFAEELHQSTVLFSSTR